MVLPITPQPPIQDKHMTNNNYQSVPNGVRSLDGHQCDDVQITPFNPLTLLSRAAESLITTELFPTQEDSSISTELSQTPQQESLPVSPLPPQESSRNNHQHHYYILIPCLPLLQQLSNILLHL